MPAEHPHALLVVLFVAALAPFVNELPLRPRLPLVVLELVFGIGVGPHGLDLVAQEGALRTLSALGLSFLFFLAGMELDFAKLRGRPLRLGILGWGLSLALSLVLMFSLRALGLVSDALLVGVALATTAIGTLLPILRDDRAAAPAGARDPPPDARAHQHEPASDPALDVPARRARGAGRRAGPRPPARRLRRGQRGGPGVAGPRLGALPPQARPASRACRSSCSCCSSFAARPPRSSAPGSSRCSSSR